VFAHDGKVAAGGIQLPNLCAVSATTEDKAPKTFHNAPLRA
jgi:hypothetical protein